MLKSHPNQGVEVQITDNQGTPPYNLRLSQNRAQAVVDELVKLGVDDEETEKAEAAAGFDLLLPNTSEANKARNRRVQVADHQGEEPAPERGVSAQWGGASGGITSGEHGKRVAAPRK